MAKIQVAVKNTTSDDQVVHAYDLFAQSKREVDGSPFALSPGERSPFFAINATDGRGTIEYKCDSGPSLTGIEVADGDVVEVG
jgi:hypothetical protein